MSTSPLVGPLPLVKASQSGDQLSAVGGVAQKLLPLKESRIASKSVARRCPPCLQCHSGERPLEEEEVLHDREKKLISCLTGLYDLAVPCVCATEVCHSGLPTSRGLQQVEAAVDLCPDAL